MKVCIAPGVWRDEGPQTAQLTVRRFSVQASVGGQMVPVMRTIEANPITNGEVERRRKRSERLRAIRAQLEPQPKPVCGVILKVIGEPCARRPGHKHDHRSRALMDSDMAMRRSNWRMIGKP